VGSRSVRILETILPYTEDKNQKAAQRLGWAGHVMLAMIVFGSILPLTWSWEGIARWPLLLNWRDMQLPDFLQNVAAFAPVGVVYGASRERAMVWRFAGVAIVVAFALQLIQLWLPERTPRFSDAVANSIGLFAGLAFARVAHSLRRLPSAPVPVEVAILLLLLCHAILIMMIEQGAGGAWDRWLLHKEDSADFWHFLSMRLFVAGFAVRAIVEKHHRVMWLFLLLCAACLALGQSRLSLFMGVAVLVGGLCAQWLPRKIANIMAIAALVSVVLWEGLTPWIPVSREMIWMPIKSLLMGAGLVSFVTLAWKLFCWGALTLLLCAWPLRGRVIMVLVAGLTACIEITQMHIASGFPDVTDILLAAGLSGLVVLVVQQSARKSEAIAI
jgi:glycopeptide antibiotics resistance protein